MGKVFINGIIMNIIKVIMLMELKKVMEKLFILMEEKFLLLLLMGNLMEMGLLIMEKGLLRKLNLLMVLLIKIFLGEKNDIDFFIIIFVFVFGFF